VLREVREEMKLTIISLSLMITVPNDYSYSIKIPKTKISVCILRRIEPMYNTKNMSKFKQQTENKVC